jgi:hypothetical protein
MTIENKFCTECRFWLPISRFKKLTSASALKKNPDGYYWCCTPCYRGKSWLFALGEEPNNRKARRREKLARRIATVEVTYGLTEDEYLSLVKAQNNLCAICGKKDLNHVLCVDHDHETGQVRGLLCKNCNIGLGNFKDDIKIIHSAIAYLQNSQERKNHLEKEILESAVNP